MTTDDTPIETSEREARPWKPSDGYLPAGGGPTQPALAAFDAAVAEVGVRNAKLADELRRAFERRLAALGSAPDQQARDDWQRAVFTLIGHAESLRAEGKTDMPSWCYSLAEKIARAHVDEATAQRVRQVSDQRPPAAAPQPPAAQQGDLCQNCLPDGRCMKRQALCGVKLAAQQGEAVAPANTVAAAEHCEGIAWLALCALVAAGHVSQEKADEAMHLMAKVQATKPAAAPQPVPIDMVLHCPACGMQHIDAPEYESAREDPFPAFGEDPAMSWDNPPHRSHLCAGCGHIWRPADVPTNGVAAVKTKGESDSPVKAPQPVAQGELPDDIRVPLHKLWADAGYLVGRACDGEIDMAVRRIKALCDEVEQAVRAALAAAPAGVVGEPVARFCPGCGSVGEVPSAYRDCCPDGEKARVIPAKLAQHCQDLFRLALDGAATPPAPPARQALTDKQRDAVLLSVIQKLNSNPYSLTKSECISEVQSMRSSGIGGKGETDHG